LLPITVTKNDRIFDVGDIAREAYLIMKGQVETRYGGATLAMDQPEFDGVDQIRIFERNAIFGEEVFDFKDNIQVTRHYTATARIPTELALLSAFDIEALAKKYPRLRQHMLDFRAKRLATIQRRMERDRRKTKGASVDKSQDVCYHCRQKGHWKAECPVLHRERMQRRQDSVDLANKLDEATTNDERLTDTEMEELLQQTESDPPQDLAQAAAAAAPQVTAEAAAPQMVTGRNNVRGQSWSDSESNSTALAGLVAAVQALQTRQETLAAAERRNTDAIHGKLDNIVQNMAAMQRRQDLANPHLEKELLPP